MDLLSMAAQTRFRSLAPEPDLRSPEVKLAAYLMSYTDYPGSELIYRAVKVGLEFIEFSKEITTYGIPPLQTMIKFTDSRKSLFRTGLFYSF